MKAATQAVKDLIRSSVDVRAVPKLVAEWEHNRYSPIADIIVSPSNPVDDVDWNGAYDLESITLPNRPVSGIAKARLNEPIRLSIGYRDKPNESRFYAPADDDIYKYWASWSRTSTTPVATNDYSFPQPIVITLTYEDPVVSNKLVVGFDLSYARPKAYDVEIRENGTWNKISSNVVVGSDGLLTLWRKADLSGQWDSVPVYNAPTLLDGIRLTVKSMTEGYSHVDVIQMGARLENDLSEFVIDYGRTNSVSQRSFIAPLGKASANEATVTLSNYDLRFNNSNEDSLYYNLIDKKVRLTMSLSIDARPAGSQDERIREFTMWVDSWGGQEQDSVSVSLKDSSVLLQEIDMPEIFWENMTVGAIIWQLMDTAGLTNYKYSRDVLDTGQVIPYFWAKEGTIWDQISQLAEATQTAIFFDEWDVLQIKTRKSMFGGTDTTIDWNLDAVANGQKLPDIIDLSTDDDLTANDVTVNWKPAEFSDFNNGTPKMETVWEPESESVVLRASALTRDLLIASPTMWIKQSEVAYWPFESLINIRGEVLKYSGKEYQWHKPGGGTAVEWANSQEDVEAINAKSNPDLVWANSFTGQLKVASRGIGGSGVDNHYVKPANYTAKVTAWNNSYIYPINLGTQGGMYYNDGVMTLQPPFNAGIQDYFFVQHAAQISGNRSTYGMRFRFPEVNLNPSGNACIGMIIDGDVGDTGFYFEISPTSMVEADNRAARSEIMMLVMPASAQGIYWSLTNGSRGVVASLTAGQWYDFEVTENVAGNGDVNLAAYLNGVAVGNWKVPAANRPATQGKNALFTRGECKADFEYFYGMSHDADPKYGTPGTYVALPDQSSFLDLVTGSFTSGFIEREFKYGQYWTTNRGPQYKDGKWFLLRNDYLSFFYDEFGPVVHEVREFDVNFEKAEGPVGHSYPYVSNSNQVTCTDYTSNAFGAKFTLVNASRRDAIISGEDKITAGEDNPIQQKFFVYGRVLYQEEENQVLKKDEQSIRRKGSVSLEVDNIFIQTKEAAEDLGQWIVNLWGGGVDEISINIFGNPLIQVGDLITVNFPVKNMSPSTHVYYVVEVKGEFSQGYSTRLICRRANL